MFGKEAPSARAMETSLGTKHKETLILHYSATIFEDKKEDKYYCGPSWHRLYESSFWFSIVLQKWSKGEVNPFFNPIE